MGNNDDRPFGDLSGSGGEPPPGPDELRAIVARSGRHHRRAAAMGMAATLIVGAAAGYLISGRSTGASTTVAVTGSPATTSGVVRGPVTGGAASIGPFGSSGYTRLFTRTAGAVTIRGFLTNSARPAVVRAAGCQLGPPPFRAELSTAKMVGDAQGFGTADRTNPISAVTTAVEGIPEGDPTATVVAATGAGVAKVRVEFTGGATDEMAPAQGWVALAAGVSGPPTSGTAPVGTLTALNASGRVLSTESATMESGGVQFTGTCRLPCPALTTTPPGASSPAPSSTTASTAGVGAAGPPTTATASAAPNGAPSTPKNKLLEPPPIIACAEPPATVPPPGAPLPMPMTTPPFVVPSPAVPGPAVPAPTAPGN
ncbi:MAG: hypothetical protein ACR2MN_03375 [Acidimicrobiales bacterium]